MRAKTINEILGFERGLNPKAAMGVGGVKLDDAFNTIIKPAIDKWEIYLKRNLVGRTISGDFRVFNGKAWQQVANVTVRVDKIVNWEIDGDINVKDADGNLYAIDINQKMHIG